MEMTLNEQLRLLIDLQQIDSTILSLAEDIENLPLRLNKVKKPLENARAVFARKKTEYEQMEKKKKDKYGELEEIQEKIDKMKAKSSEIKTNKEYEAHLKEIKNFEDKKLAVEDEILSIMEAADSVEKDLKKEEENLKKSEETFKQEEKKLEEEKKRLRSEIELQRGRRKEIVKGLDEEIYDKYMQLLKIAGGKAVVQTKNEVCLGCNTNIPPQLYNDIKSNKDIYTCYYCNRFLYYVPDTEKK
jgi:hypothetical protein